MSHLLIPIAFFVSFTTLYASEPIADPSLVFEEKNGLVAVEAEHFFKQEKADVRAFHLTHADLTPEFTPDGDEPHVGGASGGAYLEILPDTRRNHGHKLIRGENFMPLPGKMAILSYKVHFNTPGRYYVWVRAHSTGSEDNGLHVGIDGEWPESGQRLQWCEGKHTWQWDSKQRTEKQHCGERGKIFLEIEDAGEHIISFSMREDGFEFDKWLMTTDQKFQRPTDIGGPKSIAKSGTLPKAYKLVAAPPPPAPKAAQPKPDNISKQTASLTMPAAMFAEAKLTNYYLDKGKWLAINPDKAKTGTAARTFPFPTGKYNVVLRTVGENDGQSTYAVSVDEEKIGDYKCAPCAEMFETGPKFHKTWKNISITEGAIIGVSSTIASTDGKEYSRARWAAVAFVPADEATRKAARPFLAKQSSNHPAAGELKNSPTTSVSKEKLQQPRRANGDGAVTLTGELKTWHKITLDLSGPYAHEKDNAPNPFTDHRFDVTFTHADGTTYTVPGYFAADGNAGETSAEDGTVWRAHFAPDRPGKWSWHTSFMTGWGSALDAGLQAELHGLYHDQEGSFDVAASDKTGRDLRAHGRLQYVGERYLKFAGSGQYFLKVGADAPETLLGYKDFDNTEARKAKVPLKSYSAHVGDWNEGDPSWKDGKGRGLIGAINYLSGKGCNAFSFLTYNAGGDGDNVWPFIHRDDKLHYDCSKLDQWGIVFDHGTAKGMYLHFKMQETENDDHKRHKGVRGVPECLDGGNLGPQRRLYCRELIARFGHNLALNWNLGEENTQTTQQQKEMIDYIAYLDAYDHNLVIHTFPNQQDQVYRALIGDKSKLTGASLQNSSLETTHAHTVKWVTESTKAGRPWVVAFDESGSAAHAQCPDLGYNGFDGHDNDGKMAYTQHKVRKQTLWGTLMAGGAGNEYYFGYKFDQNDLVCEDWRSRDQSWDYCRIAINFFHDNDIPFWEMTCADELVGNPEHKPAEFCFRKSGDVYLVYLPNGGDHSLDLSEANGEFNVQWFNPREGGELQNSTVTKVTGGGSVKLGQPPADSKNDWLVVLRK